MNDDMTTTRREFFRRAGRYGIAAALAGGVSLLVLNSSSDKCPQQSPCEQCAALRQCALPQAQTARAQDKVDSREGVSHG